jgi:pyruvate dehydrogenase E1 component alpha subunit
MPQDTVATVSTSAPNITTDEALIVYEDMVLGRTFEDKCAEMYYRGKMFGFVHLYNGQEAVASGIIKAMRPAQCIFSQPRITFWVDMPLSLKEFLSHRGQHFSQNIVAK